MYDVQTKNYSSKNSLNESKSGKSVGNNSIKVIKMSSEDKNMKNKNKNN